jgi:hypothetical protein
VHSGLSDTWSHLFRIGDSAGTDLAEDETTTTDNDPWVEFDQDITAPEETTYEELFGAFAAQAAFSATARNQPARIRAAFNAESFFRARPRDLNATLLTSQGTVLTLNQQHNLITPRNGAHHVLIFKDWPMPL